jgi:hypothetical protein
MEQDIESILGWKKHWVIYRDGANIEPWDGENIKLHFDMEQTLS